MDSAQTIVDNQQPGKRTKPILLLLLGLLATAIAAAVSALVSRLLKAPTEHPLAGPQPLPPGAALELEGLTEDEAAARRLEGQDNTIIFKPPRSQREIWRSNIYTIFNLSLVGLMIVQLLLGKWLDALITVGVMILNVVLNVAQELIARRRIKDIEQSTRAKATVVREGQARSIAPSEIVRGDILVLGPGDQILVDGLVVGSGEIVVDESMLTGKEKHQTRSNGDGIYAGSYCVAGRGAYEAYQVGDERLLVTLTDKAEPTEEELTPLEKIVDRTLRVLMGIVAIYTVLLMVRYFGLDSSIPPGMVNDTVDAFNNAASIIFNIAPASLFFMIVLTYAAGTADLAKVGAMVHRARSVESLASADTICFAQAGILTGTHVTISRIEQPQAEEPLAESRLRQILGDYARSVPVANALTRAMTTTFPGNHRRSEDSAPFLSVHGWNGLVFDDDDLQGTYLLGYPDVLEPHLVVVDEPAPDGEGEVKDEASEPILSRAFSPLNRLFRRSREEVEDDVDLAIESAEAGDLDSAQAADVEDASSRKGFFGQLTSRVSSMVPRREPAPDEGQTGEEVDREDATALLFAYHPDRTSLHGADGAPRLPDDLLPLCHLSYEERVREESVETIRAFYEMGLAIKVFASGSPDLTVNILRQGDLDPDAGPQVISGAELLALEPDQWARAATDHSIFGHLTPEQAGKIVRVLRGEGQSVAVVGDGVSDLPALQEANVAITRQGGSQAALSVADIIVLDESPQALVRVLDKGQKIVNGLLDVLKLYLAQVTYLVLLVVSIPLFLGGFVYRSSQGSVIAIVTTQIPAILLSLWAVGGLLPSKRLHWLLGRFVIPAGLTMSIAVFIVYAIFKGRTGDVAYAQQGVTHTLVAAGLLLVVFIKPPGRAWSSGGAGKSDWRFTVLALVLLFLFVGLTYIPLAQRLLYVAPLNESSHYALVGVVVLIWAVVLQIVWRLVPPDARKA